MEFSRQVYWSRVPFPTPGDFPPAFEPGSLALQADSLLSEPSGKPSAFRAVLMVENPTANAGDIKDGFDPWVGKIPWRRAMQPTPVFLPGESHGQKGHLKNKAWHSKNQGSSDQGLWLELICGLVKAPLQTSIIITIFLSLCLLHLNIRSWGVSG